MLDDRLADVLAASTWLSFRVKGEPDIARAIWEQARPVLVNPSHRQRREYTRHLGGLKLRSCTDQATISQPIRASHGYINHGKVSLRITSPLSLLMNLSQPFW